MAPMPTNPIFPVLPVMLAPVLTLLALLLRAALIYAVCQLVATLALTGLVDAVDPFAALSGAVAFLCIARERRLVGPQARVRRFDVAFLFAEVHGAIVRGATLLLFLE